MPLPPQPALLDALSFPMIPPLAQGMVGNFHFPLNPDHLSLPTNFHKSFGFTLDLLVNRL